MANFSLSGYEPREGAITATTTCYLVEGILGIYSEYSHFATMVEFYHVYWFTAFRHSGRKEPPTESIKLWQDGDFGSVQIAPPGTEDSGTWASVHAGCHWLWPNVDWDFRNFTNSQVMGNNFTVSFIWLHAPAKKRTLSSRKTKLLHNSKILRWSSGKDWWRLLHFWNRNTST